MPSLAHVPHVRPHPRRTAALRTLAATTATAGLLLLAACGGDDPSASTTPATAAPSTSASASASGSASPSASAAPVKASTDLSALTVTGAYGKTPKVKIAKTPWAVDKTRTKVLSPGKGGTVTAAMTVTVNYFGVDGRTGKTFDESFGKGQPATFSLGQVVAGFKKGLVGQKQGSRVLVAMPGKDAYDAGGGRPDAGINVGDTLIFVIDVVAIPLTQPSGTTVTPKAGLPTVSASLTNPTVTLGATKAPTTTVVQPLIKGKGARVAATDTVTIHYSWLNLTTKKVLESDYGKAASQTQVSGLITGLKTGLTGQTVGSRVLLVVPPKDSYPNGNASPKVGKGDTSVFVVDILFTAASS